MARFRAGGRGGVCSEGTLAHKKAGIYNNNMVSVVVSVLVRLTFCGADRARKKSRLSLLVVKGGDNVRALPIEGKLCVISKCP